jgi:uncharacterized protein YcfJ
MKKRIATAVISAGLLFGTAAPSMAITPAQQRARVHYIRHKRHMKTLKRVGIGAAGGAAVGALVGGGKGGAIGALAGAGAGALYDRHKKHHGHY